MKKVLIVSYHFPPLNMIAAKRYGIMCKYLEEYGYRPYVLTTRHNKRLLLDIKMDLPLPISEDQIICIGREQENMSVDIGWKQWMIAFLEHHRLESRAVSRRGLGWQETVKQRMNLSEWKDIDLVIGTFPPMGNLFVAYDLAKKLNCPFIAEIRDLISDYKECSPGYRHAWLIDSIIERYILSRADGIVTVTPGFRDILKKRYPKKKFGVVYNGWEGERKKAAETETAEEKYLYYAGSLYLYRLESFELLIRCLKKINEQKKEKIKFIVRSIGPEQLDKRIKKMVRELGMSNYVDIREATSEDVIEREKQSAYINIVLSTIRKDDASLLTTIPGKVYELLTDQPPILAIVQKDSDVGKVLTYTHKGIATVSEKEITEYIAGDCEKYQGNRKIAFFSRKKQAQRLCKFMDKVLEAE